MKPVVGQTASFSKLIDDKVVREFATISGDENPVHLDDAYAAKTRFKKRIAHGMIGVSLLSRVMGMQLPGPGSIYLSQIMKFKAPCYIGDTLTAEVKVAAIREEKQIYTLSTVLKNQNGDVLLEGEAVVLYEPV